jgi:DNA-directed RNA polymerase specialized sigma24 family protein
MPPLALDSSLVPDDSTSSRSEAFFEQVSSLLDGEPRDPAAVEKALTGWDEVLERIGAELYHVAAMLVGEGEEAIAVIERVVTRVDIAHCASQAEARHQSRLLLGAEAIAVLSRRAGGDAPVFAAPEGDAGPASCIEDDDLDAAGVSPADLEAMISGENHRLRIWLEGLSVESRVIFVLRAIAGLSSAEVAGLLAEFGGAEARDWTPDRVRGTFRLGLCSLASQLIHATATK